MNLSKILIKKLFQIKYIKLNKKIFNNQNKFFSFNTFIPVKNNVTTNINETNPMDCKNKSETILP